MTEPKPKTYELSLPSTIEQVAKVEKFLLKLKKTLAIDEEHFYKLLVAVTEAVNNGIIHGNGRDPNKQVVLTCNWTDGCLEVIVRDEGPGFESDHLPDPLAEENLMRDHGRGVFLIRSLMDSVRFSKDDAGSEVIMTMSMQ